MLPDSAPTSIRIGNPGILFASHARNLAITILSNTTTDQHVTNICRSAYAELRPHKQHQPPSDSHCNQNSPLCLCSLKVRLLQLPPLWLTSIHFTHASKSTKFCSKFSNGNPASVIMYSLFCAAYTGYQSTQGLTTRFQPCASTLSPTLLPPISLRFYPSTPLPDTSVYPRTHAPCVFLSLKLSHLAFSQRAFSFTFILGDGRV